MLGMHQFVAFICFKSRRDENQTSAISLIWLTPIPPYIPTLILFNVKYYTLNNIKKKSIDLFHHYLVFKSEMSWHIKYET